MREVQTARAQHRPATPPIALRPLDRRSQQELRMVLDWCAKQTDWCAAVTVLLHATITGFAHAQGPQAFPQLATADALQLVREPDNPYDARAVRVEVVEALL